MFVLWMSKWRAASQPQSRLRSQQGTLDGAPRASQVGKEDGQAAASSDHSGDQAPHKRGDEAKWHPYSYVFEFPGERAHGQGSAARAALQHHAMVEATREVRNDALVGSRSSEDRAHQFFNIDAATRGGSDAWPQVARDMANVRSLHVPQRAGGGIRR